MRIAIVSGTDNPTLNSDKNHERYARIHGHRYTFDTAPYPDLPTPHFRKIRSVQNALRDSANDWVFWLDDDAYFTDPKIPLERFINDVPDNIFMVICASPVNPQGGWTFLSSGQFFIRNTPLAHEFLEKVLATPVETARAWWDASRYGMFTNGDQDSIVYILVTENLLGSVRILPYEAFNSRPYHYGNSLEEHFIVHFPGIPNKPTAIAAFGAQFGADDTLAVPK